MITTVAFTLALLGGVVPRGMVAIPQGSYTPLYAGDAKAAAVRVGPFALDRVPVTRDAFAAFTRSHPQWRRPTNGEGQYPIVDVSWYAAKAYCEAHGKRLPTTAEWERVANADAGDVLAQYAARNGGAPSPVGKSRPNALGIANLHDLIWEWTLDFDGTSTTHSAHAQHASAAHASCASAAIGASSTTNYAAFLRAALRATLTPSSTLRTLGFRCAASLSA
jgi:formylglycine-generating enzyme